MTFHVGQKVGCTIPNGHWENEFGMHREFEHPKNGRVYYVACVDINSETWLELIEFPGRLYEAKWFRPIVEKKTDTGFAILEEIRKRESEGAPAPRAPARTIT